MERLSGRQHPLRNPRDKPRLKPCEVHPQHLRGPLWHQGRKRFQGSMNLPLSIWGARLHL
jgi:hypothetical protein